MIKYFILLYIILSCALAYRRIDDHYDNKRIVFPDRQSQPQPQLTVEDEISEAIASYPDATNNISRILDILNVKFDEADGIFGRKSTKFEEPANCEPELTTVKLNLNNSYDQHFMPVCVRVKRCSGCCPTKFKCKPKDISFKSVKGARLKRLIKPREIRGEHVTMNVEEHHSCQCECTIKDNCDLSTHYYDDRACRCTCKNKEEISSCLSSAIPKQWDDNKCECKCKDVSFCSSGQVFSHETCSCVQEII